MNFRLLARALDGDCELTPDTRQARSFRVSERRKAIGGLGPGCRGVTALLHFAL
jgi:hypothetical protein